MRVSILRFIIMFICFGSPKVLGELMKWMTQRLTIDKQSHVTPKLLADVIRLVDKRRR